MLRVIMKSDPLYRPMPCILDTQASLTGSVMGEDSQRAAANGAVQRTNQSQPYGPRVLWEQSTFGPDPATGAVSTLHNRRGGVFIPAPVPGRAEKCDPARHKSGFGGSGVGQRLFRSEQMVTAAQVEQAHAFRRTQQACFSAAIALWRTETLTAEQIDAAEYQALQTVVASALLDALQRQWSTSAPGMPLKMPLELFNTPEALQRLQAVHREALLEAAHGRLAPQLAALRQAIVSGMPDSPWVRSAYFAIMDCVSRGGQPLNQTLALVWPVVQGFVASPESLSLT